MKRMALLAGIALAALAPAARAQNHGEVGAFADYLRLQQTSTNSVGLGGRFSFNVRRNLQLEAEMGYDFEKAFTEGFTSGTGTVTLQSTNLRVLDGLFGPKLQSGHGPVRVFLTLKGGFINFRLDPRPPSFSTFTSSVQDLRAADVRGAVYPGGGVEAFLGPFGLRLDVGDDIYFAGHTHNNLRVTFGPTIRF